MSRELATSRNDRPARDAYEAGVLSLREARMAMGLYEPQEVLVNKWPRPGEYRQFNGKPRRAK